MLYNKQMRLKTNDIPPVYNLLIFLYRLDVVSYAQLAYISDIYL